jgi:hypothetical protein
MMRPDLRKAPRKSKYASEYSQLTISEAKHSEGCLRNKRLEITVETYERLILKPGGNREALCLACGCVVQMLPPEAAAVLLGVRTRTIYRRIEADQLHFAELSDGSLFICVNSLLDSNSI